MIRNAISISHQMRDETYDCAITMVIFNSVKQLLLAASEECVRDVGKSVEV